MPTCRDYRLQQYSNKAGNIQWGSLYSISVLRSTRTLGRHPLGIIWSDEYEYLNGLLLALPTFYISAFLFISPEAAAFRTHPLCYRTTACKSSSSCDLVFQPTAVPLQRNTCPTTSRPHHHDRTVHSTTNHHAIANIMASTASFPGSRLSKISASVQAILPNTKWRSNPSSQSQSGFFAHIPREIRDMIYYEVISTQEQPVCIVRVNDSKQNYRTRLDARPVRPKLTTQERPLGARSLRLGIGLLGAASRCNVNPLAWLRTCQIIHGEVFSLLYYVPTISIPDICTFDSWCAALPPHRLNKVKVLHLDLVVPCMPAYVAPTWGYHGTYYHNMVLDEDKWISLWDAVAAIEGLKELQVKLKPLTGKFIDRNESMDILAPFSRLKNPEVLVVSVSWHIPDEIMKGHRQEGMIELTCAPHTPHSRWP